MLAFDIQLKQGQCPSPTSLALQNASRINRLFAFWMARHCETLQRFLLGNWESENIPTLQSLEDQKYVWRTSVGCVMLWNPQEDTISSKSFLPLFDRTDHLQSNNLSKDLSDDHLPGNIDTFWYSCRSYTTTL